MLATFPWNRSSSQAALRASMDCPTAISDRSVSGTREVHLDDAQIVQGRDDAPGAHERPGAHLPDAEHTIEGRSDDAILEPRLRGEEPGIGRVQVALRSVELLLSHQVLLAQRLHAVELARLLFKSSPRPIEIGGLLGVLQSNQDIARPSRARRPGRAPR